jgi:hypothetical protein
MAWTTIDETLLQKRTNPTVWDLLTNAASITDQPDPIPDIIEQVVNEVRGYIAAARYKLEAGQTIPSRLVGAVVTIILWRASLDLNCEILLTDVRGKEYKSASDLMERVAAGKFSVEEPVVVDSEAENATVITPAMNPRERRYTRRDEDGI